MFPLELWHIDGNHKLIRWRFVVHGGIDGFSRIPVFLRCATNNRAETVKDSFVQAVQEFGLPLRVRCDKGGENVDVAQFMWSLPNRSQEFGSILMGKSVHNQRIERLWKDVFSGCLFLYYQLFNYLEDCMLLDPCNEVQLFALHYIFLPRIQDSLDHFRQAYIQHPISSARNQTPAQLWTAGLIRGIEDNRRWADELYQENPVLYGIDFDGPCPLDTDNDVVIPETNVRNGDECLQALKERVDPLYPSVNYGLDLYLSAVDIIGTFAQQ